MSYIDKPFTDQIWQSSGCVDFEMTLRKLLEQNIADKKIHVRLVDRVAENYRDYNLVITDNVISNFNYQPLWPEYWGSFSYCPQYQNNMPTRLFNCFINRTDQMRQCWFYQLVRRNLIDQGWVSFLLDYKKLKLPLHQDIDKNNKSALYQWVFEQGCQIFEKEHEQMRSHVPFQNFSGELEQVVCDSRLSLVIETYFDYPNVIAFSEKIFRALQLPRPFLLYCEPGAMNILRSQGFDVFDDVVNHSYDTESNSITRQVKILDELDNARHIVYNKQTLEDFEQRAEHNRRLLRKFKHDWPNKLEKVISEINNYK
jgi:hypothetical protein